MQRTIARAVLSTLALVTALAAPAGAQMLRDTAQSPRVMPLTPPSPPPEQVRVAWRDSLKQPESVKYDPQLDTYFVSNIDGGSLAKDHKGSISRVNADGSFRDKAFIESGRNGVVLDAPKGMAIVGDTLWVADITAMRAFNRQTGAPIASVDLTSIGAEFLNDVVTGPDGAVYVTDTELHALPNGNMTHPRADRIFRISPSRAPSIALQTDRLHRPNGIAWDAQNARFLVVPFGGDTVMAWKPGASDVTPVATGPGHYDGVIVTPSGRVFVSSKATSAVHELRNGKFEKVIQGLMDPADIEYDAARDRIVVPITANNLMEAFKTPLP